MRSSRRGGRFDPVSTRPYRPGDDLRKIDRHASARLSAARGEDALVVREHYAEEAARVHLLVDDAPTMALYPPGLPFLHKPAAVEAAAALVVSSAWQARSRFAREQAPPAALARLELPRGSFVFVVSDFLAPPPREAWLPAIERGLDVVPVIVQDPVWEQSFPEEAAGVLLPVVDPADGRLRPVRLRRTEAHARRVANEARLAELVRLLERTGLDPVVVSSSEPADVLARFLLWAELRRRHV